MFQTPNNNSSAIFENAGELAVQLTVDFHAEIKADQLDGFANMIHSANQLFNLTAHKDLPSIFSSLFYESLAPYRNSDFPSDCCVADIGSGSGVPGLLLKMIFPHIRLTVIESNAKKCEFMKNVIKAFSLSNVSVLCLRAEDSELSLRESFDVVTARAVTSLPALLELLAPLAKVGGTVICPKSKKYWLEIEQARRAVEVLGLNEPSVRSFVSKTGIEHNVAIFLKSRPTPAIFPRKWSQILANPL